MNGIIQKNNGVVFTAPGLRRLKTDTVDATGVIELQDYANPACHVASDGVMLYNIASTGTGPYSTGRIVGTVAYTGKGLTMQGADTTTRVAYLDLCNGPVALPGGPTLLTVWITYHEVGFRTNYQGILAAQNTDMSTGDVGNQFEFLTRNDNGSTQSETLHLAFALA